MTAPLIWIVIPAVAGLLLWFQRRQTGRLVLVSVALTFALALFAWVVPIGEPVRLGPLAFNIGPDLAFAGRRLVLNNTDRSLLVFLYALCAFWFAGSSAAGANNLMIPFGLGIVALLVAALAVEPFLYAALLIEMAVLIAVPMLAPPGKIFEQGVLRFLIFQTLAMPFILLAGWALAGVETNPSNVILVTLSSIFLALGFAFWLAVFPFYTWIPLLSEQTHPYVSGFLLILLPTVNLMLGVSYLDRFGWLRANAGTFQIIGVIGVVMVVTAGVWAAFQRDLARIFGYNIIVETGYSLLAISLASTIGQQIFTSMLLPRVLGVGLWAISLSTLARAAGGTHFDKVTGFLQKAPFATAGLAVASLSLAGLPVLAVFPIHQVLLGELSRQSLIGAVAALAGSIGMLFSAFRALSVLARGAPTLDAQFPKTTLESRLQIALLVGGITALLLIGLFPQVFLPLLGNLLDGYALLP